MTKAFFLGPVLFIIILAGSLYYIKAVPEEDNSIEAQINRELASFLQDDRLSFQEIKKGMVIPLHSLIATFPVEPTAKPNPSEVFVTLVFPRSQLGKRELFILTSQINTWAFEMEPFAHRGVETVLYQDYLIVTIHDGIMFHLRNGIPANPDLKVFRSEDVRGIVTEVRGKVYLSTDHDILSQKLAHKWAFFSKPSFQAPFYIEKTCNQSDEEAPCTFQWREQVPKYPPRRLD